MRKFTFLFPLLVAGCTSVNEPPGGVPMPLINAAGVQIGTVRAWQTTGGVTFRIVAEGLPHGVHGLHVHSVGRCDAPDFASAGPHWNPAAHKHGLNNPQGPHAGDLRNINVAANGVLGETVTLSGASLTAPVGTPGSGWRMRAELSPALSGATPMRSFSRRELPRRTTSEFSVQRWALLRGADAY